MAVVCLGARVFRPQIDDNSASIQVSLQLADSMCEPQWMVSTSNVFSGPALDPQEVCATVLLPLVMDVQWAHCRLMAHVEGDKM